MLKVPTTPDPAIMVGCLPLGLLNDATSEARQSLANGARGSSLYSWDRDDPDPQNMAALKAAAHWVIKHCLPPDTRATSAWLKFRAPGDTLRRHADGVCTKLTVALQVGEGCIFTVGEDALRPASDLRIQMKAGEVWQWHDRSHHGVINDSNAHRIVILVFCMSSR